MTPVFVATGAFDCGKTTTLEWLRDHHGLRVHGEAHLRALALLGPRREGHPPDQGFTPIDDPDHFWPLCRPFDFAELVLEQQRAIEASAAPGDLLERGSLDPIEMLLRTSGGQRRPAWEPVARYRLVFSFEVMAALQRPRWAKTVEQRVAEARAINRRLEALYLAAGYELVRVAAGTVEARAQTVLAAIRASGETGS